MKVEIGSRFFEIDMDDYKDICDTHRFYLMRSKTKEYIQIVDRESKKRFLLHRYLFLPIPSKKEIDHIDGNGLNNKRSNLRLCTRSENNANRIDNGSKGVHFEKQTGKFRAMIWKDNKKYSLGRFSNFADAKKAYAKKALELFGEFARLKNDNMFDGPHFQIQD